MASRRLPTGPVTARPRSGWVFLGFTLLVTVSFLMAAFAPVRSSTPALATLAVVVSAIAYIYFVAPRLVIDDEAIRVENSWRTHVVPWGALVEVETRFGLVLVTAQGTVHVQAAPSPGLSALRRGGDPDRGTGRPGSPATLIRDHWQALRDAGALDPSAEVTTRPRVTHLSLTWGGAALAAVLWVLA